MKRIVFILTGLLMVCAVSVARDFYVSPAGSDDNPGTNDKPFATLERARGKVRELKKNHGLPAGGINVWLCGGLYTIEKPFELAKADSGTKDSPIVYRGCEGEQVRMIGGCELTSSDFKPVTDRGILKRVIEQSAHSKVLQCNLKALGISDFGQEWPDRFRGLLKIPALFCNGQMMRLARWPNSGWAHVEKVLARG